MSHYRNLNIERGIVMGRMYTTKEAAEVLMVGDESIRRWIRDGKIEAIRGLGRHGSLIEESELNRFIEYYNKGKTWKTRERACLAKMDDMSNFKPERKIRKNNVVSEIDKRIEELRGKVFVYETDAVRMLEEIRELIKTEL